MPEIEVHIVPNSEKMGGAGEPGVRPIAPAHFSGEWMLVEPEPGIIPKDHFWASVNRGDLYHTKMTKGGACSTARQYLQSWLPGE